MGPAKSGAQQREVLGYSDMEDLAPGNAPGSAAKPSEKRVWEEE